ncbi:MAG: RNA-binding protein [Myxococcales bacterium]|nr:MAG: RNA-binding protein [Myxococcales bacterium]
MIDDLLGQRVALTVRRFIDAGALLGDDEILLPRREVPDDAQPGDELDVFVYLDSEDRPVLTRALPRLERGQVTFLEVVDLARFGAFVDWGLPKDLLIPLDEQTRELHVGDRHPFGLIVDATGRLAGTMRISEMLRYDGDFKLDEWVEGEAWRQEPDLGVLVILERAFLGLLPAQEPHNLQRGQAARFRVTHVHRDGKVELSLRNHAHEERDVDASVILEVLGRPNPPRLGDRSSPDEIRARVGLSKKAFKRAVGGLLKRGAVQIDADGWLLLTGGGDVR